MQERPATPGLVPVPESIAAAASPWVAALRQASGDAFRALYVHGSALTSRFDPQASDVNLLLVVGDLPFVQLEALARTVRDQPAPKGTVRRWSPLVLTESQITRSLDVFPAEFLDLQARRALLAGDDVLARLEVSLANLRHQCEYELRSKLVGLRQAFLLAGAADGTAHRLLVQAAGGTSAVYRHLLTLRRLPAPDEPEALAAAVADAYATQSPGLDAPFAARRAGRDPGEAMSRTRFAAHLVALETLIGAVDAFPTD
jgi:hypothetical protein